MERIYDVVDPEVLRQQRGLLVNGIFRQKETVG
jgi:hypothetical protein